MCPKPIKSSASAWFRKWFMEPGLSPPKHHSEARSLAGAGRALATDTPKKSYEIIALRNHELQRWLHSVNNNTVLNMSAKRRDGTLFFFRIAFPPRETSTFHRGKSHSSSEKPQEASFPCQTFQKALTSSPILLLHVSEPHFPRNKN